jgi:hypothetical protein
MKGFRHLTLEGEFEGIMKPLGFEMHAVPGPQKKIERFAGFPQLGRGTMALDECGLQDLGQCGFPRPNPCGERERPGTEKKPEDGVEITQAAGAVLDVGLKEFRGLAVFSMPGGYAIHQILNERFSVRFPDLINQSQPETRKELLAAAQMTRFEEGHPGFHVARPQSQTVFNGPHTVTDIQTKVKEFMEELWTANPASVAPEPGIRNMMSVSEPKHSSRRPYPPRQTSAIEDLAGCLKDRKVSLITLSRASVRAIPTRIPPVPSRWMSAIARRVFWS